MAKRARRLSLLFDRAHASRFQQGFGQALAAHLVGTELKTGDHVHLPGWPTALVDEVEPNGAEVGPGTHVEMHVPPPEKEGALSLAVLVDASLTMGKGGEDSKFQQVARILDAVLLNGRNFLTKAGVVVQGGTTRHVEPLTDPEELTGAVILKTTPKGTFDLEAGIERAVDLLAGAPEGPRAVLVLTDGSDVPKDDLGPARPALRAGTTLVAIATDETDRLDKICHRAGGIATTDPEAAFHFLAELAGTKASWSPPETPARERPSKEEPYEFEVVIEAVES